MLSTIVPLLHFGFIIGALTLYVISTMTKDLLRAKLIFVGHLMYIVFFIIFIGNEVFFRSSQHSTMQIILFVCMYIVSTVILACWAIAKYKLIRRYKKIDTLEDSS